MKQNQEEEDYKCPFDEKNKLTVTQGILGATDFIND